MSVVWASGIIYVMPMFTSTLFSSVIHDCSPNATGNAVNLSSHCDGFLVIYYHPLGALLYAITGSLVTSVIAGATGCVYALTYLKPKKVIYAMPIFSQCISKRYIPSPVPTNLWVCEKRIKERIRVWYVIGTMVQWLKDVRLSS